MHTTRGEARAHQRPELNTDQVRVESPRFQFGDPRHGSWQASNGERGTESSRNRSIQDNTASQKASGSPLPSRKERL